MKKKWLFILSFVCGLLFLTSCGLLSTTDYPGETILFAAYTKYDGGEVEMEGETQRVKVGKKATLQAFDTDEYEFLHWEFRGEIVSTEREFVLKPTENDIYFHRYYAVFTPKDETKALVNVICEKGGTLDDWWTISDEMEVSGGGYYTIGETATLQTTDRVGLVRTFAYENRKVDGPVLELPVEKNITITAKIEKMVEILLAENEYCTLTLNKEDRFLPEYEDYQVSVEMETDEYVPDSWEIKDYVTGEVLSKWEWEWNTTLEEVVIGRDISLHNRLLIDLVCTNENIVDTLPVEVVSATGDQVCVEIEKQKKMISGRAFVMNVTPDENTYIQDVYILAEATEEFPFPSRIDFWGVQDIYKDGGKVVPSDPRFDFGENCKVVLQAIPREKAAVVNVISDEEIIEKYREETGKNPSGFYAPSLSTTLRIVEKNKEQYFNMEYSNNVYAIYEIGFQFSHIEDERGRKFADNLHFTFTVDKDTNFYIKWTKKPVFDPYFDYTPTRDGTGYVAKLSQLANYTDCCPKVEEITLPYYYNGKPVKEIANFGISSWRNRPTKLGDFYSQSLMPVSKIVLPYTIEKIGEYAFATFNPLQVVIPEGDSLSYISPNAFWSPNNSIKMNLSEKHLGMMLQTLHTKYIGENENFTYVLQDDSHFELINELAHYEALSEYICIRKSMFSSEITSIRLGILYHEFFHHYQIVATLGVGEESLETMKIKPTAEEIEAWKQPYDKEDYNAYYNHPLEVSARAFAEEWSGWKA